MRSIPRAGGGLRRRLLVSALIGVLGAVGTVSVVSAAPAAAHRTPSAAVAPGAAAPAALAAAAVDPVAVAASSYVKFDTDTTHLESGNGKARLTGGLVWYHGKFPRGYIHRGEVYPGTKAAAVAPVGCIWARINWGYPAGSVSFPPGASISGAAEVGKFFRSCRRAGQRMPSPIRLTGLTFTKAFLNSATYTVCNSARAADGPRNCSNEKEIYGD